MLNCRFAAALALSLAIGGCGAESAREAGSPDVEIRGGEALEGAAMPVTADTQVVELPDEEAGLPGR